MSTLPHDKFPEFIATKRSRNPWAITRHVEALALRGYRTGIHDFGHGMEATVQASDGS